MEKGRNNGGTQITKAARGQKMSTSYGKDNSSSFRGPASAERDVKMGGGVNNLSHSLTGVGLAKPS